MLEIVNCIKSTRGNLENVDGKYESLCNICMNSKIETQCMPCGHKLLCKKCMILVLGKTSVCFVCLKEITGFEIIK